MLADTWTGWAPMVNGRCRATLIRAASNEASGESAIKNANDYNAMLVDFTLVNANHAFSFLQKLPRVRSLADFAELSAEHARQQMAAWSNQAQQLTKTIAQKAIPADNSTAR